MNTYAEVEGELPVELEKKEVPIPETEKAIVDMLKLPKFDWKYPLQVGKDVFTLDGNNYSVLAVAEALGKLDVASMRALLNYPLQIVTHNNISGHGSCGGYYYWSQAIRFTNYDYEAVRVAIQADSAKMFPEVTPILSRFGFSTDVVSDPDGEHALAIYYRYKRFLRGLPGQLQSIPHDVVEPLPLLEEAKILENYRDVAKVLGVSEVEGLNLEKVKYAIYEKASEGIERKLFLSEDLWQALAKIHDADVHLILPAEGWTAIFDEEEKRAYADFTPFQRTVLPVDFLKKYDAAQSYERYLLRREMDEKLGLQRYYTSRFMACREHFVQLFKELDDLKTGKVVSHGLMMFTEHPEQERKREFDSIRKGDMNYAWIDAALELAGEDPAVFAHTIEVICQGFARSIRDLLDFIAEAEDPREREFFERPLQEKLKCFTDLKQGKSTFFSLGLGQGVWIPGTLAENTEKNKENQLEKHLAAALDRRFSTETK